MGKLVDSFLADLNRKRWSVAGGGIFIKTQELQFALETIETQRDQWLTEAEQKNFYVWNKVDGLVKIPAPNPEDKSIEETAKEPSQSTTESQPTTDELLKQQEKLTISIMDGLQALGMEAPARFEQLLKEQPLAPLPEGDADYHFKSLGPVMSKGTSIKDTTEIHKAVSFLTKQKEHGVVVFYDVDGNFMEEKLMPAWSYVLNLLQNNWGHSDTEKITTIFLGQNQNILPDSIRPYVNVIDFPLPDYEELEEILDDRVYNSKHLVEFYGQDYKFDLDLKRKMINSALGLTRIEFATVIQEAKQTGNALTMSDVDLINKVRSEKYSNSALERYGFDFNMEDVGGLENLKDWLTKRETIWELDPKQTRIPRPKGILLTGLPGTGKSLTAKVVASLFGMPLLRFDIGAVFGQYYGQSESGMREALKAAEASAPCILWIDEIEKAFGKSGSSSEGNTFERVKATFLTWMQEHKSDIFTIATANDVEKLPMEMVRKGRFDETFFLDLPNDAERKAILSIHLKKRLPELFDELNLDNLSAIAKGFVGAEIEQVIISAMIDALNEKTSVNEEILIRAFANTQPLSVTQKDDVLRLRKWAQEANAVRASLGDNEELSFI